MLAGMVFDWLGSLVYYSNSTAPRNSHIGVFPKNENPVAPQATNMKSPPDKAI